MIGLVMAFVMPTAMRNAAFPEPKPNADALWLTGIGIGGVISYAYPFAWLWIAS